MEEQQQEQQAPEKYSQRTLKFLIRHIGNAAARQKEREEKVASLDSQITILRKAALSKKQNPEKIKSGFEEMQKKIENLVKEEKVVVVNQKKEYDELQELQERIDLLEEKVFGLHHLHSKSHEEHNLTMNEHKRKLEDVEKRVEQMRKAAFEEGKKRVPHNPHLVISTMKNLGQKKKKRDEIRKLELMVRDAEKKHKEFQRKKYPKKHLETLRILIDKHKKKIANMKKDEILA